MQKKKIIQDFNQLAFKSMFRKYLHKVWGAEETSLKILEKFNDQKKKKTEKEIIHLLVSSEVCL